jgi:hypothetical protein
VNNPRELIARTPMRALQVAVIAQPRRDFAAW